MSMENLLEQDEKLSILEEKIKDEMEWMSTTENDEYQVITLENLEGILSDFFGKKIKLKL